MLMYHPLRHEAFATSLPFMPERGISLPLLLGPWIIVRHKIVAQRSISPIHSLSIKENVMQDLRDPKASLTRLAAAAMIMLFSQPYAACLGVVLPPVDNPTKHNQGPQLRLHDDSPKQLSRLYRKATSTLR